MFIDLRKAFDTVSHPMLIETYGIRGNVLELCASYLKNRTQFVVYDGVKSDVKSIDRGVPQGSNLGPLIFIVFMNDIFHISQFYSISYMHPDNTGIFLSGGDLHILFRY